MKETNNFYEKFKNYLEAQSIEIPDTLTLYNHEKKITTRTIGNQTNSIQKKDSQIQTEKEIQNTKEDSNSILLNELMILDFKIRSLRK